MSNEINEKRILDQFDELKINLMFIKKQLEESRDNLESDKLAERMKECKNFFTEHIINKLEENIDNKKLIEKSKNLIKIIENYINDVENTKNKISDLIKNKKYNPEDLNNISSSIAIAISNIPQISVTNPNYSNAVLQTGKTLLYGGSAALFGGLVSLLICPIISPFLLMGGTLGCSVGAPLTILGDAMESIKEKAKKIFKWNK